LQLPRIEFNNKCNPEKMDRFIIANAIATAHVVIFDEEEEVKNVLEKVDNFVEEVIPRMTTKQFRQHFRMDPHIFEDLLRKLYTIYPQVAKAGNQELDLEKQVLLCIWYIANLESFR
jgi:hypothetical protein